MPPCFQWVVPSSKKAPDSQKVFHHILGNLKFNVSLVFGPNFGLLLQSDTKLGHGPVSSWSNKGVACFAIVLPPVTISFIPIGIIRYGIF
jgi:hypothetical protein